MQIGLVFCLCLAAVCAARPTVVVTGATGYVGRNLLSALPISLTVVAMQRTKSHEQALDAKTRADRAEIVADITDSAQVAAAIDALFSEAPPDVVVHCAAKMDFYPADAAALQQLHATNVGGTVNILTAVQNAVAKYGLEKPPLFIYISSTEALGPCTYCDESAQAAPAAFVYDYGKTKQLAEAAVRSAALPWIILRPTGIFGPANFFSIFELIVAVWSGAFPLAPQDADRAEIMYTHIDDVVQGIVRVVKAAACELGRAELAEALDTIDASSVPACSGGGGGAVVGRVFHICADRGLSTLDWIKSIAAAAGRQPPVDGVAIPTPVLTAVMTVVSPLVRLLYPATFFFRTAIVDRMLENRTYDNSRAKQLLGFHPVHSPSKAIAENVQWYVERRILPPLPLPPLVIAVAAIFFLTRCALWLVQRLFRK